MKKIKEIIMVLVIVGITMILVGCILELLARNCYEKEPKEFFESRICRYVANN